MAFYFGLLGFPGRCTRKGGLLPARIISAGASGPACTEDDPTEPPEPEEPFSSQGRSKPKDSTDMMCRLGPSAQWGVAKLLAPGPAAETRLTAPCPTQKWREGERERERGRAAGGRQKLPFRAKAACDAGSLR